MIDCVSTTQTRCKTVESISIFQSTLNQTDRFSTFPITVVAGLRHHSTTFRDTSAPFWWRNPRKRFSFGEKLYIQNMVVLGKLDDLRDVIFYNKPIFHVNMINNKVTLLAIAAEHSRLHILEFLIKLGANPNIHQNVDGKGPWKYIKQQNILAIDMAIFSGQISSVEYLLQFHPDREFRKTLDVTISRNKYYKSIENYVIQ